MRIQNEIKNKPGRANWIILFIRDRVVWVGEELLVVKRNRLRGEVIMLLLLLGVACLFLFLLITQVISHDPTGTEIFFGLIH